MLLAVGFGIFLGNSIARGHVFARVLKDTRTNGFRVAARNFSRGYPCYNNGYERADARTIQGNKEASMSMEDPFREAVGDGKDWAASSHS